MEKTTTRWSDLRNALFADRWAFVPLRLAVGFGFAAHGYAKLARGPEGFATVLAAMDIPAPGFTAWTTTFFELVGGVLVMLGAFTVPISVPLVAIMLTAMVGVHLPYGFSSVRLKSISAAGAQFGPIGYELNVLYIAALVALAMGGSSPLSLDRWLAKMRTSRQSATSPPPIENRSPASQ